MLAFYLKKLLRCPATWAGALLFFLSLLLSAAETLDAHNPTYLYEYAMNLGVSSYFIPVITVLPICFVRRELSRGSAWQLPLLRSSPGRFAAGGLAAACLSGAAVTLLGFACFFLTIVLRSGDSLSFRYTFASAELHSGLSGAPLSRGFFYGRSYLEATLIEAAGLALMSMLHPAVAYLISGFSDNQYLCAAAPFTLYVFSLFGFQRLAYYVNKGFLYLDPSRLNPSGSIFNESYLFPFYVLTYVLTVVLSCGLVFRRRLRRRLSDG